MAEKEYTSAEYILRCAEIIRADKEISERTIQIMFLEYGRLLLDEKVTYPDNTFSYTLSDGIERCGICDRPTKEHDTPCKTK